MALAPRDLFEQLKVANERFIMQSIQAQRQPWLTKDFEFKFRQAFGREMTPEEREFFGLNTTMSGEEETQSRSQGEGVR